MREARKIPVFDYRAATPLDECLEAWIDTHRHSDIDIGWRRSSPMLVSDAPADSSQLYKRMDNEVGNAVDAEVAGLPAHLRWAMRKCCGMVNVWNFPSLVFEDVVVDAKRELENKLKKNVATSIFFV